MSRLSEWSRRLGVRLALSFTLLIMVVTAALTYRSAQQETDTLRQQLQQHALVQANNLAASVAAYIVTYDYTSIESILSSAVQFENILGIQVADTSGKVLGDVVQTEEGDVVSRYEVAEIVLPKNIRQSLSIENEHAVVWQPVELGDVVGWVRIDYSFARVAATHQHIWRNNIANGLLLVLASLVLLMLILRKPLRSIEKYTDFADTLEEHEGQQTTVDSSSRELDKLGTALNKASLNLRTQHLALNAALGRFEDVASIAEHSPDIIFSINNHGEVVYLNSRAKIVLDELGLGEDRAKDLLPDNFDRLHHQALVQHSAISKVESSIQDRSFAWKLAPFTEQSVLHCHAVEITEQKIAQKALHDSESRYKTLFDSATDGILLISQDRFIDFNPHAASLFACSEDDLRRSHAKTLMPETQPGGRPSEPTLRGYIHAARDGQPQFFEWQFRRLDGSLFDAEVSLNDSSLGDEAIVLAIVRDITQRKLSEARLIRQANFDTLTGLPNRILALDRLSESIKRAHRLKSHVAVLFIDVDHFKTVNDSLGHSVGDELIIEVATRLRTCVREGDTAARFGGDEFMVILNDIDNMIDTESVLEKILATMKTPFFLAGQEFFLGASIGVSGYPTDGEDAQVLLRNADAAMYKAKEAGRNTFQFYAPEFNQQAKERVQMEVNLRKALERQEFFLTYQPQIDIQSGDIIGAEALIRWQSPELGLVQPDEFIKLAEETGMIIPIGEWVLRTACHTAAAWQKDLGLKLRISVNVSQRQFASTELITQVSKILRESTLPAELLELEITESLLMDDSDRTLDIVHAFKQLGLSLALDDFGTGYSSLSYLKRFPFDVLKIDRAFVNDITHGVDEAGLCIAILAIASTFHMSVIAEGVEDAEQLAFLHTSGADVAQGFYFSKPLQDEDFREYVRDYLAMREQQRKVADQL
ncbi:MAG: EAL domain-containing protein [Gammaproteobacteria bacterium]